MSLPRPRSGRFASQLPWRRAQLDAARPTLAFQVLSPSLLTQSLALGEPHTARCSKRGPEVKAQDGKQQETWGRHFLGEVAVDSAF